MQTMSRIDWSSVDWRKPVRQIAEELSCTRQAVYLAQARRWGGPEKATKQAPAPRRSATSLKLTAIISFLLLFAAHNIQAWSGAGHQVIAAEAYRQLSPALKAKVAEILKSHPEYEKWKASFADASANVDPDAFIFMRASTWPDEIRRQKSNYNHPKWHYIDYPLKPPKFPVEPGPDPADDILYGIGQCEKVLSNAEASAQDRAAYLSWLIHLIGDEHMPLHCCSLFTSEYPTGDRGGNSFFIMPGTRGIPLHSFWDGLLGTSGKPQSHLNYAIMIEHEHPRNSLAELIKAKTPKDWSLESRGIAVEKAYLRGELKGGTSKETAVELPQGYSKAAKVVAEKQAALAGYRLANEIATWITLN